MGEVQGAAGGGAEEEQAARMFDVHFCLGRRVCWLHCMGVGRVGGVGGSELRAWVVERCGVMCGGATDVV